MKNFAKVVLILLFFGLILVFGYTKLISDNGNAQTRASAETQKNITDTNAEYVSIYLLTVKPNGENVFTKIPRILPKDKNKLTFAVMELLKGPNGVEINQKYYSEIPRDTKLLSVMENDKKVIINLTSNFQYGGGSDSLYSRVQQLLKTVLANSPKKDVYLYLDGKQADVLGGEGLMIKQPLDERSIFDD